MLKTFVCFHLPDSQVHEEEVETRSIKPDAIPVDSYAYEFFDRQVVEAEDGELCYGEPRNRSDITVISPIVLSKDELKEILKEMEEFDFEKAIFTPSGEIIRYDEDENYRFVSYPDLLNM